MSIEYNMNNPFKRKISATQSRYQMVKKNDGTTGQGSYNLSVDLKDYLLSVNAIVKNETLGNDKNVYYTLANDVKLSLKRGIIDLIGPAYDNDNNEILFVHTIANDGTNKFQIKRTDHKNEEKYQWFTKLYDNNCEGATFIIYYDDIERKICVDNDLNVPSRLEDIEVEELEGDITEDNLYSKDDFLKDVFIDEEKYDTMVSILEKKKNIILEGAPGVGKTFMAKRLAYSILGSKDEDKVELIQFHQNYSYEEFIEGYRPTESGFELKHGIFYNLCEKAKNDLPNNYYLIIDEINRGNLSKIFGELLMLIERDKRGEELTLAYSENNFTVPENLYIIGLMNTADRSLALIDYALRRRFSFIRIEPAFDNEKFIEAFNKKFDANYNNVITVIKQINEAIKNDKSLGSGFKIGHSYFYPKLPNREGNKKDIEDIITYEIIPLLEEYWYDDEDTLIQWKNALDGVLND